VFEELGGGCFVTGLALRIDAEGMEFVNAGHEPAWLVERGAASRLELIAELPLGVVADHEYTVQTRRAPDVGDGIAMFSDGPVNAQTSDGSEYGSERLRGMLETHWSANPLRTAHDVVGDVIDFIGENQVSDDITAVVLQRRPGVE